MSILKFILLTISLFGFKADSFFSFETFEDNSKLEITCIVHDKGLYDCGEWGGHYEYIEITKINGVFKLSFKRDPNRCDEYEFLSPVKPFKGVVSKEIILNDHEKKIIEKYIASLIRHAPHPTIRSNAADWYQVRYKDRDININDTDNSFRNKHLAFKKRLFD